MYSPYFPGGNETRPLPPHPCAIISRDDPLCIFPGSKLYDQREFFKVAVDGGSLRCGCRGTDAHFSLAV
jgi:hypothetical protein